MEGKKADVLLDNVTDTEEKTDDVHEINGNGTEGKADYVQELAVVKPDVDEVNGSDAAPSKEDVTKDSEAPSKEDKTKDSEVYEQAADPQSKTKNVYSVHNKKHDNEDNTPKEVKVGAESIISVGATAVFDGVKIQ